ncbi:hypothetical protein BHM03_00017840 [Ensete ventricosum]|nr:hypothetical protein BHM03_00017840 [Ensete ventricosum]
MPTWLWCWRGSIYNSDVDVDAELARALMGWAGPLSVLSFFSSPSHPPLKEGLSGVCCLQRGRPLSIPRGFSPCSLSLLVFRSPKIARLQLHLSNQVGMASSSTTYGFTSSPSSSSVSSPQVGSHRFSGIKSGWSEPCSSSSGVMTRADIKAFQTLEVMKSCHDFDSILIVESLVRIRKRYSILDEYALHAPSLGQCPYDAYPGGFNISVDALEVGLRFPLHPVVSLDAEEVRVEAIVRESTGALGK